MEKYLVDLFVTSAQEQVRVPGWLIRLCLSIFGTPIGKALRLDMVKDVLQGYELQGKRVLDVGCGVGDLSFMFAGHGANVVGIELDAKKVARATKIAEQWHFDELRFIARDALTIEQMNLGQFDAIFCIAVLEHVQDDFGLLRQMQSVLRPGGILVLQVPSARRKIIPAVEAEDGHVRLGYIPEDMPKLLADMGFRLIKLRTWDPLGLFYYWYKFSRIVPGPKGRGRLFTVLAPLFITLIRLTTALIKRPGTELCLLAVKE